MGNVNHKASDVRFDRSRERAQSLPRRSLGWKSAIVAVMLIACNGRHRDVGEQPREDAGKPMRPIAMAQFDVTSKNGSCLVTWRGKLALTVKKCPSPLRQQSLPIVVADTTYAIFTTDLCDDQGVCEGMNFYVITTSIDRIWTSPVFGEGNRLARIATRSDGITLHLESAPAGDEPSQFEIRMGEVRKVPWRMKEDVPSSVPRPPSDEAPKIVQLRDGCALTWQGRLLLEAGYCEEDSLGRLELAYASNTPIQSAGAHFYVYQVPCGGGGNGVPGYDIYVVAVTDNDAWISDTLGAYAELEDVATTTDGISLTLLQPDGKVTCRVTKRASECSEPDSSFIIGPEEVSRSTVTVTGDLREGSRSIGFLPMIFSNAYSEAYIIDEDGPCSVQANLDHKVKTTLHCVTYSDTSIRCRCEQLRVLD